METETLDKLYLEWSQFTTARTRREIRLLRVLDEIIKRGHNQDCLFCGLKDRLAMDILKEE